MTFIKFTFSKVIQIPALENIFSERLWYTNIKAWTSHLLFIKKELIKCCPEESIEMKTYWNRKFIATKLQNINVKFKACSTNDPTSDMKHNECCDKILNNFEGKSFLTDCFKINFMFFFQKDFSDTGYQMKLFLL